MAAAIAGPAPRVVQWLQTPDGFKNGILKPCIWLIDCYEWAGNSLSDRVSSLQLFSIDLKNIIDLRRAPVIVDNFVNSLFACITAPSMQNLHNVLHDFRALSFPVFYFLDTWNRRIATVSHGIMSFAYRHYVFSLAYFSIGHIANNIVNIIAGVNVLHNLLDTAKRISNLAFACLALVSMFFAPVASGYFLACSGGDIVFSIAHALV